MSVSDSRAIGNERGRRAESGVRRAYEKPRVLHVENLEVLAVSCNQSLQQKSPDMGCPLQNQFS